MKGWAPDWLLRMPNDNSVVLRSRVQQKSCSTTLPAWPAACRALHAQYIMPVPTKLPREVLSNKIQCLPFFFFSCYYKCYFLLKIILWLLYCGFDLIDWEIHNFASVYCIRQRKYMNGISLAIRFIMCDYLLSLHHYAAIKHLLH